MRKITLFKTMLFTIALFAGSTSAWAQCDKADDFATLTATGSYGTRTTTNGWVGTNAAVLVGGATESSPIFPFIGSTDATKSMTINGKTTTIGTITSPTLSNGCGSLSFSYGNAFSETNGVSVKIEIKQGGTVVWCVNLINTSVTQKTLYTYSKTGINVSGNYTLVITNNCPSASTSNKDRVSIWGICMTNYSSSTPTVAIPVITPTPGNCIAAQSVSMTCGTAGASIYYTTNGSDPTEASTKYTAPFSVSSTTTVKAKAFLTGYDPSVTATATYTFPTEVANIAALRAGTTPGFYKLIGEVVLTLKSATRNSKYIQDATGAALIDDNSGVITTAYNVGDGITGIIATTALYNGMLQLTPVADPGAATSTSKTITPLALAMSDLASHQAELVKVSGVTISDIDGGTGSFQASKSHNLNGATNPVLRTQYSDLDYIGQTIPTSPQDIIGVVLMYNTTAQLVPRSLSDMVSTGLSTAKQNLKLFAANGKINFEAAEGETVEVYNTVGQKVLSTAAISGNNSLAVNAKGVVFVKVGNRTGKVIL